MCGSFKFLPASACILDDGGRIVCTSDVWDGFAGRVGIAKANGVGPGVSYLEACSKSALSGDSHAAAVYERLRALLHGLLTDFTLEYPCQTPAELLWFAVKATAFDHGGKRWVIIVHNDITDHVSTVAALRRVAGDLEGAMKDRVTAVQHAEQRIALLAQINDDGIWDWCPGNGEFFVSKRMLAILDRAAPMSCKDFLTCLHPDDAAVIRRLLTERLVTGGSFDAIVRILRHHAPPVRALVRGNASAAGNLLPGRVVGTLTPLD